MYRIGIYREYVTIEVICNCGIKSRPLGDATFILCEIQMVFPNVILVTVFMVDTDTVRF